MSHGDKIYSLWNIFNNHAIYLYGDKDGQKVQIFNYKINKY